MFNRKDWSKNNPENLSTLKVGKHISSSFSMFTIYSFKSIEMYTEVKIEWKGFVNPAESTQWR